MWRRLLVPCALVGCTTTTGIAEQHPDEVACEARGSSYTWPHGAVDLLLVVDTSAEMAPYRDRWIATLTTYLGGLGAERPDFHVGVIAADAPDLWSAPQLDGCTPPAGDFVVDEKLYWYQCDDPSGRCPRTNYEGALVDAVTCIAALPAAGDAPRTPLDAAARALAADTGFRRPDAWLAVVFVSAGDDASPGDVAAYADVFRDHALAIAPPDAARLDAVAPRFVDLASPDWTPGLEALLAVREPLLGSCIRDTLLEIDVDPANPGFQPDCAVATFDDEPVPPCTMAEDERPAADTPRPCWWIGPSDYDPSCPWQPHTEGVEWADWRCASTCEG